MTFEEAIQHQRDHHPTDYVYREGVRALLGTVSEIEDEYGVGATENCAYFDCGGYRYLQVLSDGRREEPSQWGTYPVRLWFLPLKVVENRDMADGLEVFEQLGRVYVDAFAYDIFRCFLEGGETVWEAQLDPFAAAMPKRKDQLGAVAAAIDAGIVRDPVNGPTASALKMVDWGNGGELSDELEPVEPYDSAGDQWTVRAGSLYHRWHAVHAHDEETALSVIERAQECIDFVSAQVKWDIGEGMLQLDYFSDVDALQKTVGSETGSIAFYNRNSRSIGTEATSAITIPYEWAWCLSHELFHHVWHQFMSEEEQAGMRDMFSRREPDLISIRGQMRHDEPHENLADVFADYCCTTRARQILQTGTLKSILSSDQMLLGMRARIGDRVETWCVEHGFQMPSGRGKNASK